MKNRCCLFCLRCCSAAAYAPDDEDVGSSFITIADYFAVARCFLLLCCYVAAAILIVIAVASTAMAIAISVAQHWPTLQSH